MTPEEKQIAYRDARSTGQYDSIWQSVGKCVFCDLREKYVFFEENGIVMTISLYAYIDGHFMIVPRRHVKSSRELSQLEWDTIRKFLYVAKKLVRNVHGIKGMQLVQKDGADAQSTVEHVHFHCIPFDAPDLCQWNYRELTYTPLENVALYKQRAKELIGYDTKFSRKYSNRQSLPLVCDLVIFNDQRQVLLQERAADARLVPDTLTLPGGTVEDFSIPLEQELLREVQEETGLQLDTSQLQLVASRVGSLVRRHVSRQLKIAYPQSDQFLWNSYVLTVNLPEQPLTAGDDCAALLWIDLAAIGSDDRISQSLRDIIAQAGEQRGL